MGRKGMLELLFYVNIRLDIKMFEDFVLQLILSKGEIDFS